MRPLKRTSQQRKPWNLMKFHKITLLQTVQKWDSLALMRGPICQLHIRPWMFQNWWSQQLWNQEGSSGWCQLYPRKLWSKVQRRAFTGTASGRVACRKARSPQIRVFFAWKHFGNETGNGTHRLYSNDKQTACGAWRSFQSQSGKHVYMRIRLIKLRIEAQRLVDRFWFQSTTINTSESAEGKQSLATAAYFMCPRGLGQSDGGYSASNVRLMLPTDFALPECGTWCVRLFFWFSDMQHCIHVSAKDTKAMSYQKGWKMTN